MYASIQTNTMVFPYLKTLAETIATRFLSQVKRYASLQRGFDIDFKYITKKG